MSRESGAHVSVRTKYSYKFNVLNDTFNVSNTESSSLLLSSFVLHLYGKYIENMKIWKTTR